VDEEEVHVERRRAGEAKQTAKLLLFASDGRAGLVLVKVTCAISKAARHPCPLQKTCPADAEKTKKNNK
jgi:hypothetical protein